MNILIDFDGTCVTHQFPQIGEEVGAAQVLRDLVKNGHNLILFTMRAEDCYLDEALDWFQKNKIKLYGINVNPEQHKFTRSPKAYGDLLIDDISLGIKKLHCHFNRPCVDWKWVSEELGKQGLLTAEQIKQYNFSMQGYL
ncbi:hypothetical protein [Testudinibacter aquarius]|uniref:Capsule biosynthesis phosphatase n=1 Tax=Testudinibacter aquarius TaxID=1524974 RepID=A0A4R3Y2E6_9PAST|nr:hypothetical protein [Testudinibacter aquarius]KAE9527644.1 hypothetical protein A1D24_11025 [Testudinibacter aquarius]TCV85737.1 hypothetical protein EDC16_10844 [Testudinibacter aquarius]TNG85512.1 hypothetical protein FHQ21_12675 [Testudinibacter aquarius]